MSQIKSRNTKLEVSFLKLLSAELYPIGYRYRKHYAGLAGKPDIVFIKQGVVVFLDGDFWHGYNLQKLGKKVPKKYWLPKIKRNIARDKKYSAELKRAGWKVLRFWEHQLKANSQACVNKIKRTLNDNQ